MKKRIYITLLALAIPISGLLAQETIFNNGVELGIGARAIGMGGAYSAVGEDYSATYWNPAALAQIRRFEISGGFSHLNFSNTAKYNNIEGDGSETFTRLSELGIVYPVPTYRGSLVFGFGVNRVKAYDGALEFLLYNPSPGDSVDQRWSEKEDGTLTQWMASGAMDVSPNFSLGASINIWGGAEDYTFAQIDYDVDDIYYENEWRTDTEINSAFSAFNLTFGALFKVNNQLRLSATFSSPRSITVNEEWSEADQVIDDNGVSDVTYEDDGEVEYKIRSPFMIGAGASYSLAGLLLSGQLEFADWTKIEYLTDPPIAGTTRTQINDEINRTYRATTRVRLGAEFTLPGSMLQLRAGYFSDPSMLDPSKLQAGNTEADRQFYSLGLGYLIDKQTKLDVAYVFSNWERANTLPFGDTIVRNLTEDISYKKFLVTLSYRL